MLKTHHFDDKYNPCDGDNCDNVTKAITFPKF